jgi:hypothetical protein
LIAIILLQDGWKFAMRQNRCQLDVCNFLVFPHFQAEK